jgi:hypothetical protein
MMGYDSHAFFEGLKKSDLSKLADADGCEWTDYYDLDFWLLEDDCHEPVVVSDGKALLTNKILEQLKDVINDGGFGTSPEIDEEYKDRTLAFITDALKVIQLGGKVFYQSDDMASDDDE